jgi:hypothetical protein
MAYVDRAAIANSHSFIDRVRVALMTAAVASGMKPQDVVLGESDYSYKMRVRFCIDVIYANPDQYLSAFTWALVWDSSLVPNMVDIEKAANDMSPTGDASIQQAVNSVFEFMAKNPQ